LTKLVHFNSLSPWFNRFCNKPKIRFLSG